jgi:hypothetical protein
MSITLKGERVVEVDGIKFTIRPQEHNDMVRAFAIANMEEIRLRENDPDYKMDTETKKRIVGSYAIMERIVAWDGIEIDGEPAPCTGQNKNRLFGQVMGLVMKVFAAIQELESDEAKNSEATQAG